MVWDDEDERLPLEIFIEKVVGVTEINSYPTLSGLALREKAKQFSSSVPCSVKVEGKWMLVDDAGVLFQFDTGNNSIEHF